MTRPASPIVILLADDDPDDRMLAKEALEESRLANQLHFVEDGEELLDYLYRRGAYADPASSPRPGLILLDLNMPRKDGREALREIKSSPELRPIPVLVFTTSRSQQDIDQSYDLGVNAFLTKPDSMDELTHTVRVVHDFWFRTVRLPA